MACVRKFALTLAAAFALLPAAASASVDLVTNGGFENGLSGPSGFSASGWRLISDGDGLGTAHSGNWSVYNNCVGGFERSPLTTCTLITGLHTQPGQSYDLSFWLMNDAARPGEEQFRVAWNQQDVAIIPFEGTSWTQFTFTGLIATYDITRLDFGGRNDRGVLFLDDISVVATPAAVPEPAAWAMMLIGFGGIGMAMRRRRRNGLQVA